MENQIQIFTNQLFGNVRSILDQFGNPWFVGKDVAVALGYVDTTNALKQHVDSIDRWDGGGETPPPPAVVFIDTLGRQQTQYPVWINESGLYSLIFGSKLPNAKEFTHWVTSEVLPAMRKIGFNRSIQILQEENMKLKGMVETYQNSNLASNIDRSEIIELRNQTMAKILSTPDGTPMSPELRQYLMQYDPNWEG